MGIALTSCTVPQAGSPNFALGEDEMEIGVGIHGEPGRMRGPLRPAAEITALLAGPVLDDLPFRAGDRVLAFVNGLGGTPMIELYIVYHELARLCAARGIAIARNLVGTYMTSLDMAGCTLTLVRMDDELISLWDAPVKTPALRWGI
jgi:dihydroxyacetone kinase-like protein